MGLVSPVYFDPCTMVFGLYVQEVLCFVFFFVIVRQIYFAKL